MYIVYESRKNVEINGKKGWSHCWGHREQLPLQYETGSIRTCNITYAYHNCERIISEFQQITCMHKQWIPCTSLPPPVPGYEARGAMCSMHIGPHTTKCITTIHCPSHTSQLQFTACFISLPYSFSQHPPWPSQSCLFLGSHSRELSPSLLTPGCRCDVPLLSTPSITCKLTLDRFTPNGGCLWKSEEE